MAAEFIRKIRAGCEMRWLSSRERPFFIFDEHQLELNLQQLKAFWNLYSLPNSEIFFSVKSNPNPALLRKLAALVDGFDVSSLKELALARTAGIKDHRITVSGPAKTPSFLRSIAAADLRAIHIDSTEEYYEIGELARGRNLRLSLRIGTPDLAEQKLGLSEPEVESLLSQHAGAPFVGLHCYLGRELFSNERLESQLRVMSNIVARNKESFAQAPPFFIGAGLPDLEKDLSVFMNGPPTRSQNVLHLEAGKAMIGNTGTYFARVLSVKRRPNRRPLVIVDGGWQHIGTHVLSPTYGGLGVQTLAMRNGYLLPGNSEPYAIYGSLCLAKDVLNPHADLPTDLRRGDWVALFPVGAYGLSASPANFIGQNMADEFMVDSRNIESLAAPLQISGAVEAN